MSDDLKENATLQKFKDVGSLSSSYLSMQEMLGSRVKMPSEESSEDEVNDAKEEKEVDEEGKPKMTFWEKT